MATPLEAANAAQSLFWRQLWTWKHLWGVWDPPICSFLSRSHGVKPCTTSAAASAGATNKLKTTLGNTIHFHNPFITFKLTFTGFLCLLSLWQQHNTVPALYASAACPNGRTDYHACFLSPPCSLQHPINRNLHFFCHLLLWQQHGMSPTTHTSTMWPNGWNACHAAFLQPPLSHCQHGRHKKAPPCPGSVVSGRLALRRRCQDMEALFCIFHISGALTWCPPMCARQPHRPGGTTSARTCGGQEPPTWFLPFTALYPCGEQWDECRGHKCPLFRPYLPKTCQHCQGTLRRIPGGVGSNRVQICTWSRSRLPLGSLGVVGWLKVGNTQLLHASIEPAASTIVLYVL